MKNLYLLLLFFCYQTQYAQISSTIVEYDLITYNNYERISNNYLYLSENKNIFLLYGKAKTNIKFENISTDFTESKISSVIEYLPSNSFYFNGYMTPPKKYLSLDNAPKIEWELKNE